MHNCLLSIYWSQMSLQYVSSKFKSGMALMASNKDPLFSLVTFIIQSLTNVLYIYLLLSISMKRNSVFFVKQIAITAYSVMYIIIIKRHVLTLNTVPALTTIQTQINSDSPSIITTVFHDLSNTIWFCFLQSYFKFY